MKKTIKLAVVAALALGTTSAFATNGSNLIGMGVKTRGMGGTSIGISHGAESAIANPALISTVQGTEISFGGTIFMPDVKNTNGMVGMGTADGDASGSAKSAADMSVIPEVSIVTKVNDNLSVGVGMWGTAGMGVDYRSTATSVAGNSAQMNMVTNLQLMQFGVPLAYTTNDFTIGITPLLQYGSLDMDYTLPVAWGATHKGAGVAQDLRFGYNLGLTYNLSGLTIGAIYKSQIDMKYTGVLSSAVAPFTASGTYANDSLSTPEEYGVGVSYVFGEHTVALDIKEIKWSKTKGYQDFEWDDQTVVTVGYEYATKGWTARAGYNHAKSPISEQNYVGNNSAGLSAIRVNTLNLLGFPAIVESHYAIGGTYNVNDKLSVDVAYVYAAEETNTYTNFGSQDIKTTHSQNSLSLGLNYDF